MKIKKICTTMMMMYLDFVYVFRHINGVKCTSNDAAMQAQLMMFSL